MAFTYGFYNSENHDRTYDAIQFGSIFDGVIQDGVFEHYEKCFLLKDTGGVGNNVVIIQPGRAWFNHTWIYNDADFALEDMPIPELVLERIDAVVMRVDHNARENTIEIITGEPASTPTKPEIVNHGPDIWDYPLAYITRHADNPKIYQADIENVVGTSECPFSTGLIEGITTDELVAQWSGQWIEWSREKRSEFITWFNNIQYVLDGDVAGHLQNEIDDLKTKVSCILVDEPACEGDPSEHAYAVNDLFYSIGDETVYRAILPIEIDDQLRLNQNIVVVDSVGQEIGNIYARINNLDDAQIANDTRIYMDYHDGKYGYNTSPTRGADTFHPFSDMTEIYDAVVSKGVTPASDSPEDIAAAIRQIVTDVRHNVHVRWWYRGDPGGGPTFGYEALVDGRKVGGADWGGYTDWYGTV